MKYFKELWSDAVWSKVIAAGIVVVLGTIFSGCYSLITTKPFFYLLVEFLQFKVEIWQVLTPLIFVAIFYLFFVTKKIYFLNTNSSHNSILVNLTSAVEFNVATEQAKLWLDNKEVGNQAIGRLEIKNGVLNLIRMNNDGRFIIRLLQYFNNNIPGKFIQSNIYLEGDRNISVSFKAKIIGGSHTIRVICIKKDSFQWLHNATF